MFSSILVYPFMYLPTYGRKCIRKLNISSLYLASFVRKFIIFQYCKYIPIKLCYSKFNLKNLC